MSWTADKTGWLIALGGSVVGYLMVKMSERRSLRSNPDWLDVDGYEVYIRPGGHVRIRKPGSNAEEFIGTINGSAPAFTVILPSSYTKPGVESALPDYILQGGITKRTLYSAAKFLVDAYRKHHGYAKGGAWETTYKRHLGEEFDAAMEPAEKRPRKRIVYRSAYRPSSKIRASRYRRLGSDQWSEWETYPRK
jgi:hypothetical protein